VNKLPSFWTWLFRGEDFRAGWRKYWNPWLILHIAVGGGLAWLVPLSLREAANAVLLPLAGIFVGLSFAWAGNAQALMQTSEIEIVADHHRGGFREYVFTFQSAILTILVTLGLWGLAGLGVFDRSCPWSCPWWGYSVVRIVLFASASITLRECWHVVLGAQWMLLAQREVKRKLPGGLSDPEIDPTAARPTARQDTSPVEGPPSH
jgi:hypothetical protein